VSESLNNFPQIGLPGIGGFGGRVGLPGGPEESDGINGQRGFTGKICPPTQSTLFSSDGLVTPENPTNTIIRIDEVFEVATFAE